MKDVKNNPGQLKPLARKPGFLKSKLTAFVNTVAELAEPLYWTLLKFFHIKEGSRVHKLLVLIGEHYIVIFTVIVGYFLARGVLLYPARHIVVYSAVPVFLILAFANPLLAIILYLVFALGMLHRAIWNFPSMYMGTPLLLLALLGWGLSIFKGRAEKVQFVPDAANFPALGLWTMAMAHILWGRSHLYQGLIQATWVLAFFVCTHIVGKDKRKLFYLLCGFAGVYAFYVLKVLRMASYYGFSTIYTVTAEIPGRLADNNELAAALNIALPLFYALFLWEPRDKIKLFWLGVFVLDIAAIISASSRGGYITLAIVFLLVFFRMILVNKKKALPILFLTLFVIGGYGVFYEKLNNRLRSIMNWQHDQSALNRITSVVVGWEMLKAHPWGGVGMGKAYGVFMKYCPPTIVVPTGWGDEDYIIIHRPSRRLVLHNAYGQMAGETGVPGLTFFLLFLLIPLVQMRRLRKLLPRAEENNWVFPLSTALEIALISYIINATFLSNAQAGIIYVLVALTTSLYYVAMGKDQPKSSRLNQVTVTWLLVLFGYWFLLTAGFRL